MRRTGAREGERLRGASGAARDDAPLTCAGFIRAAAPATPGVRRGPECPGARSRPRGRGATSRRSVRDGAAGSSAPRAGSVPGRSAVGRSGRKPIAHASGHCGLGAGAVLGTTTGQPGEQSPGSPVQRSVRSPAGEGRRPPPEARRRGSGGRLRPASPSARETAGREQPVAGPRCRSQFPLGHSLLAVPSPAAGGQVALALCGILDVVYLTKYDNFLTGKEPHSVAGERLQLQRDKLPNTGVTTGPRTQISARQDQRLSGRADGGAEGTSCLVHSSPALRLPSDLRPALLIA
ncbi:translation initiation factor IF-2-like [Mustela erminea]|uniref:translation initiation factor IF-2-like n=1 Tax=Mustela erminea TaxID=36723 RepID=UPI001386FD0C|nr:translation initiation factor IF-2-like [Mustela erminea]